MKQRIAIPFLWPCFSFVRFALEIQQAGTLNRGLQYGTVGATEASLGFLLPIVGSWRCSDTEPCGVYSRKSSNQSWVMRYSWDILAFLGWPISRKAKRWETLGKLARCETPCSHTPELSMTNVPACSMWRLPAVFLPRVGCSKIIQDIIWGNYR